MGKGTIEKIFREVKFGNRAVVSFQFENETFAIMKESDYNEILEFIESKK